MADSKPDAVPTATEPAPVAASAGAVVSEPVVSDAAVASTKPASAAAEAPTETPAPVTTEASTAPSVDAAADAPAKEDPVKDEAAGVESVKETVKEPSAEATDAPAASSTDKDADKTQDTEKDKAQEKPQDKLQDLWAVAEAHAHPEVWGVTLADPATSVPSQIVLQKYLNANDGDFVKAKDQLTKTLDWRAQAKPLDLVKKSYNKSKFGGLGYVTTFAAAEDVKGPESKEVFTWNIYGGAKSIEQTFGTLQEFIDWRVALMELALQDLSIATATVPITASYDPYKIYQVHDYKSISFLRQPTSVRTASSETIKVMAQNYPELLKEKFFVNVPAVMGFMYGLMKLFVAPKTLKKFHPMSNGTALAGEFKESKVANLGEQLPKEYGGQGADLDAAGKETPLEE